ncbi:hypothetical protein [Anaerosporobacter faecicola]|uniref:hypothetical protein n=1 Tax=Anaerosporobacter faecicola TaxID=2718714 RepID=UPI00143A0251|nr:hypothetical protein [Anaerosporobacter faecicola]
MLKKQAMEYSRGDSHWLGDGIYLYKHELYVFRWLVIMYKDRNDEKRIKEQLFKRYSILDVDIDYNEKEVFSLIDPGHKILFEHFREQCEKKASYSKRLAKQEFTDGVVINIMFNNFEYGNKYSMVEAIFPISNCQSHINSRTNGFDEYQLCVKNPKKILKLVDCSSEFEKKMNDYFKSYDQFYIYKRRYGTNYKVN